MQIKKLVTLIIIFCSLKVHSQNLMGLLPLEERDSVFILFLNDNSRYYVTDMGVMNGERELNYKIFLEFGVDLRFTTGNKSPEEYTKIYTFEELENKDIKDYWFVYENYMDEDIEDLVEKLKWKSSNFFLVIPDSSNQTAKVLDVFNTNNSSH